LPVWSGGISTKPSSSSGLLGDKVADTSALALQSKSIPPARRALPVWSGGISTKQSSIFFCLTNL